LAATFPGSSVSNATGTVPRAFIAGLWHVWQYFENSADASAADNAGELLAC
jgi:hypothetical protein